MKTLTPEQKARAAARREEFKTLWRRVAKMTDDERIALASKCGALLTCEGRALSPRNMALVALQHPQATVVGGFRQWLRAGRAVRKGEHGAMIWVPSVHQAHADAENGPSPDDVEETRFLVGTVFDISQTEEVAHV